MRPEKKKERGLDLGALADKASGAAADVLGQRQMLRQRKKGGVSIHPVHKSLAGTRAAEDFMKKRAKSWHPVARQRVLQRGKWLM